MTSTSEDGESAKELLTVREAARVMGISERSCRRMLQLPDFPSIHATPHKTLIPRGRLLAWLGYFNVSVGDPRHGLTVVPTVKGDHS